MLQIAFATWFIASVTIGLRREDVPLVAIAVTDAILVAVFVAAVRLGDRLFPPPR